MAHPLLIVLGKLAGMIPLGPQIWRFNALSAVAGAIATANLVVLVRRFAPKGLPAACFAAGAFALAHTVWWLATITESHMILAALMSAELLVLVSLFRHPRMSMVLLLGLLSGLGFSAHNLALLALPAYGVSVIILSARRKLKWQAIPLFVLAWCAGASLLLALVFRQAAQVGLAEAFRSALFGEHWQENVLGGSLRAVAFGSAYVVYNFPNFALPLAAVGLWRLRRLAGKPLAAVMAYILVVEFLFAVRYTVADQFMFFVPFYLMVSLLAGLGLSHLCSSGRRWLTLAAMLSLVLGPIAYAAVPAAVRAWKVPLPGSRRRLVFRDDARYWLTPWKHNEDSAERFARKAVEQIEAGESPAILFADNTSYWPLRWVADVEGKATRLRLAGGTQTDLLQQLGRDPQAFWEAVRAKGLALFVVSNVKRYCPDVLLPHVDAERTGVLYRIRPPGG